MDQPYFANSRKIRFYEFRENAPDLSTSAVAEIQSRLLENKIDKLMSKENVEIIIN